MSVNIPDEPIYPSAHKRTSVDEMIRAKGIRPIRTVDDLAADLFESDEELDEFLEFTYAARRRDLA